MLAEIITIGDEILIGQIVDTNSAFISKELYKIGVQVYQITSIQDDREHILQALKDAKNKVDIVIVTGGLGPTKDDITKQTFCEFLNDTLVEDDKVLQHVKKLYKIHAKHPLLPESLYQALVPSKATILHNEFGTAPGMWMEKDNTAFVSLPGVPYEMKNLISTKVIPRLIEKFEFPFVYYKTLLTFGMGESEIVKIIHKWEDALPEAIKLAYLPSFGRVRLRLSSKGTHEEKVKSAVNSQMEILKELLKDIVIGFEDETTIVQQLMKEFVSKKQTLSIAESCTGGAIVEQITAQSGVSSFFRGSIVAYATKVKTSVLGVEESLIKKYTVVSKEVAEAMAIQSAKIFKSDYAISTTGNAGPNKGDADDEIGTVFIAIASPSGVISEKYNFGQPREKVIAKATLKALEMVRKEILKN
ncbi:MAG: competence/damage-inducible protein A [Flavobacteriaceae bacterium]|nr:competence/damage-inducible protein A [Flavobacteriaceae bacterium]